MVPIRDFEDDYYEFDEKNYCLIGRRKKRIYTLGDPIKIQVARVNMEKKLIDFALVEDTPPSTAKQIPVTKNQQNNKKKSKKR